VTTIWQHCFTPDETRHPYAEGTAIYTELLSKSNLALEV